MTKAETARLLAMIAAFDRRTIGESDVEAWHLIVGDLEAFDCAAGVREHYAAKRDWIMPADVRTFAEAEARRREGRIRRAELNEQLRRETAGELQSRPVAALTVGQPIRQVLARAVSDSKRRDIQQDTTTAGEAQARREQARQEIEQVRAAADGGTE